MNDDIAFVMNAGALGDFVASLPVLKYAVEKVWVDGNYSVIIPMHFKELLYFVPDNKIYDINKEIKFSRPTQIVNLNYVVNTVNGPSSDRLTPLKVNLTDYASINLLQTLLTGNDRDYVTLPLDNVDVSKFNLPKDYVCIIGTDQYQNRTIPDNELIKVAEYFKLKGITPVYVGKVERESKVVGAPETFGSLKTQIPGSISIVNQTSLLEVAKVMNDAVCVIGSDTGLIHLAGCTKATIVAAYSNVDSKIRLPQRSIGKTYFVEPEKDKCRFCQSSWHKGNWNYNECFTKTYECSKDLTSVKIIKEIENANVSIKHS